jgi:hypothetical protein
VIEKLAAHARVIAKKVTSVLLPHLEKETLTVDVMIPGHEPRKTTALFERTRKLLIEREGGRCYISGLTAEEIGHPLEAHHHPVERCFATMIDWRRFEEDARAGFWGARIQAFDWDSFDGEKDPYQFVDDMTVNGLLLGKPWHTGKDEGIHDLPFPVWLAQKYGKEGYKFSDVEIIHHEG